MTFATLHIFVISISVFILKTNNRAEYVQHLVQPELCPDAFSGERYVGYVGANTLNGVFGICLT